MKGIKELLMRLKGSGINIFLENGKLKTKSAAGAITPEIAQEIRGNKESIIEFLSLINDQKKDFESIPRASRQGHLKLSFAQQRLWLIDRLNGGSAEYNMPVKLSVSGDFDVELAQSAINIIIQRHEPLRTNFIEIDGEPFQVVKEKSSFHLESHDLTSINESAQQLEVSKLIDKNSDQLFKLDSDLMIRGSFVHLLKADKGLLLFCIHHIAADGWSMGILIQEFVEIYEALKNSRKIQLDELEIQYIDYAEWQRKWLENKLLDSQLEYWKKQLVEVPAVHSLPLDFPRPTIKQYEGKQVTTRLSASLSKQLSDLSLQKNVTHFMLLHSAIALLFSRHSNHSDVVIGTAVANRARAEVTPLIGFFINTLVLRVSTDVDLFDDYLEQIKQVNLGAQANQDIPFEKLVEHCNFPRTSEYTPLVQLMFTMNTTESHEINVPGLTFSTYAGGEPVAKFDISISAEVRDEGIDISWVYDKSIFSEQKIIQLSNHLENLLNSIVSSKNAKVQDLLMLSANETNLLLNDFNKTEHAYPDNQLIHQLFEQQVELFADKPAVVFNENVLSYQQLNQKANQLAGLLISKGVSSKSMVGLMVERSNEMMIAILAILKTGAAYVPLDPDYPAERINFVLQDINPTAVVINTPYLEKIDKQLHSLAIELDSQLSEQTLANYSELNSDLSENQKATDLAYIIYTSGSTGAPKGVMVEHGGVINMSLSQQRLFEVDAKSKVLHFASLGFDASVSEWLMALLKGATLYISNDQDRQSPHALESFLIENQISHATIPPALLELLDADKEYHLQSLIVAGESCEFSLAQKWLRNYRVFNAYGPTEVSVCASMTELHRGEEINIGKPIDNTQLYVLGKSQELLPLGAVGELYVGGKGLARGYVNRSDLTNERFIQSPFSNHPQDKLYRTGDLVRFLPDGKLKFVGREDEQVKIRGFRIELGEIEFQLSQCDQVESCLLMVDKDNSEQKRLLAYVVNCEKQQTDLVDWTAKLRNQLLEKLPVHMVPSLIMAIDSWPLTNNGKIDKKALPLPEAKLLQNEYVEPGSETERMMVKIWSELLSIKENEISVTTSFFELGGHSLLAVRLANSIENITSVNVDVRHIFNATSVRELAQIVDREKSFIDLESEDLMDMEEIVI